MHPWLLLRFRCPCWLSSVLLLVRLLRGAIRLPRTAAGSWVHSRICPWVSHCHRGGVWGFVRLITHGRRRNVHRVEEVTRLLQELGDTRPAQDASLLPLAHDPARLPQVVFRQVRERAKDLVHPRAEARSDRILVPELGSRQLAQRIHHKHAWEAHAASNRFCVRGQKLRAAASLAVAAIAHLPGGSAPWSCE